VTHCAKLIRVLDVNKATLKLVGADTKEQLQADLTSLLTKESLETLREELITLAYGALNFKREATIRKLSGEKIHVILCLSVAPGYETSLGMVMVSLLDITDRKLAEGQLARQKEYLEKQTIELVQAKEAAEAAGKVKERFLSNINHELRTPLNPILGFARLLKRQPNLTSDQRYQVDSIQTSGEHLLELIDDIINFCQTNDISIESMAEEFDLARLIHDIRIEASTKAYAKKLAFRYDQPVAIPDRVRGHEGKLKQVLQRLLDNAIKFTTQGGIALQVLCADMTASQTDEPDQRRLCHIQFEVEDTGPGVSKEKLETIFESFAQAPPNGKWAEGMGLGLAICRQLVENMGGTIAVASEVGRGSTFTVAFDMEVVD
jgi:signal transduction histidine kinase